jgi:hypothetical protein
VGLLCYRIPFLQTAYWSDKEFDFLTKWKEREKKIYKVPTVNHLVTDFMNAQETAGNATENQNV